MDVKTLLKKAKEWWDLIGFAWPALLAAGTFAFAWLAKAPAWMSISALATFVLCLIVILAWRLVTTTRKLRQVSSAHRTAIGRIRHFEQYFSGENWPAADCFVFHVELAREGHAATVKSIAGHIVVDVDFYLSAKVICPLPVSIKQFNLKVVCIGPGITATGSFKEMTGWGPREPKSLSEFHVKARLDGQVSLESLADHARFGVEGTVVVSSDLWEGQDRLVPLPRLSEHGLVANANPRRPSVRESTGPKLD